MASLQNVAVKDSYTSLLKLDGNTASTADGDGSNAVQVKTGDNDATPLYLNTDRIGIGGQPSEVLDIRTADSTFINIMADSDNNSSDTDVGIYFSIDSFPSSIKGQIKYDQGDDKFTLGYGANKHLYIDSSGNLGVGGSPSTAKLEIHGGTYNSSLLIKGSGANSGIVFYDSGGVHDGTILAMNSAIGFVDAGGDEMIMADDASGSEQIRFGVVGNTRMKIDTNSRISLSNNDSGSNNTIFGKLAGVINSGTSGDDNVYIGENAGKGNTTYDTASTADKNIAIGNNALPVVQNCHNNTAIGYNSQLANARGQYNTSLGGESLKVTTETTKNTAIGYESLRDHQQVTNNGVVEEAFNTALGFQSIHSTTTGIKNTGLGASTAVDVDANNQTVIGYGATSASTGANTVVLGNADVTSVHMSQDSQAYVHAQNVPNHVANTMSAPYYRFDGSNDEIAIADNNHMSFGDETSDNPFSISAWIYMEEASDFQIFNKGTYNSDGEYRFECSGSDKLSLLLFDESGASTFERATTTATIPENKWVHVCATYNGVGGASANGGITLYLNGVSEVLSLDGNGTYVAMESLASEARIGNSADSTYSRGSIQNLKIWNKELTATEVKDDYSGASVPFKYKGANQTNLLTGTITTPGTSYGYSTFSSADATGFTASNGADAYYNTADIYSMNSGITKGKAYRLTYDLTVNSGSAPHLGHPGNTDYGSGLSAGTGNYVDFVLTTAELYVFNPANEASNYVIDNMSLVRIGAVAEYDGSGANTGTWADKSGNDLHGTVSGATLENVAEYNSKIIFPSTQELSSDPNHLDDYEEGDFAVNAGNTDGTNLHTLHGTYNSLCYTKIGNLVHVQGYLEISSLNGSASGYFSISLPFDAKDGTDLGGRSMGSVNFTNTTLDGQSVSISVEDNGARAIFYISNSGGVRSAVEDGDLGNGGNTGLILGFTYLTD